MRIEKALDIQGFFPKDLEVAMVTLDPAYPFGSLLAGIKRLMGQN